MYDLGAVVGLAVNLTDSAGAPANATTVTLTITLPDGTTVTPSVTNPPATTGAYVYDYTTVQAGHHEVRWVFLSPGAAFTDSFDVRAATPGLILSLADAKQHLNVPTTNTTDDDEIREHILAVTGYIESKVGPVVRRQHTEIVRYVCGGVYDTRHRRVLSVDDITVLRDSSNPITLANIDIDAAQGTLYLIDGTWFPLEPWAITYTVGRPEIPANILLAAKLLLRYTWDSQRGAATSTPLSAGQSPAELLAYGVNIPPRALALLESARERTGFA